MSAELINDDLSKGRVEICRNGTYHTLCADIGAGWDNSDAVVVCKELGFSPFGKINIMIFHYAFRIHCISKSLSISTSLCNKYNDH